MPFDCLIPNQKAGHYGCARAKCKQWYSRRGCCGDSKEVRKDTFTPSSVLIKHDSNGFVLMESFQNIACRAAALNRHVAAGHSVSRYVFFDQRVIDRPGNEPQRIAVDRVCK